MEPQNTGSFGAGLGGTSALKQAMQRRGLDASVLDQVSAAAPGEQVMPPAVSGSGPQVGDIASQAVGQAEEPKVPFRSAEMETSLKALEGTVKTENKIAESMLKLQGVL